MRFSALGRYAERAPFCADSKTRIGAGRYNRADMRSRTFSVTKSLAALGTALFLAFPALASAQQTYGNQPSYAQPPPVAPTYANQTKITGTISGFDGQWVVYMHDDRGYTDHITLHQGTIINPTGIKLLEGMKVTVYGYADGSTFQANAFEVAYSPYSQYYTADGNPAYGYGDSGYGDSGYGYGSPYGYGYGYAPYGLGIGINWGWGWGWGWPGYWGYPGYWGGYWGGYPCCYGGYPYRGYYPGRYRYPGRGGWYPGYHGSVNAPPGGRAGTVHAAPGQGSAHGGGGGGSVHGGGGRPPR